MPGIFGEVTNPLPQVAAGSSYGDVTTGLPALISNIIGLIALIGGVAMLINFLLAGSDFITSAGDPKKIENAWRKIYISLIGLIIIVAAFLAAGLAGKLLFGDYTALLKPKIFGPGTL